MEYLFYSEEKQRRTVLEKHRLYLIVYFNDIEITKSNPRTFNTDDFCVTFAHIYTINVFQMPQTIDVKVQCTHPSIDYSNNIYPDN
jgi:hypothetical protein